MSNIPESKLEAGFPHQHVILSGLQAKTFLAMLLTDGMETIKHARNVIVEAGQSHGELFASSLLLRAQFDLMDELQTRAIATLENGTPLQLDRRDQVVTYWMIETFVSEIAQAFAETLFSKGGISDDTLVNLFYKFNQREMYEKLVSVAEPFKSAHEKGGFFQ